MAWAALDRELQEDQTILAYSGGGGGGGIIVPTQTQTQTQTQPAEAIETRRRQSAQSAGFDSIHRAGRPGRLRRGRRRAANRTPTRLCAHAPCTSAIGRARVSRVLHHVIDPWLAIALPCPVLPVPCLALPRLTVHIASPRMKGPWLAFPCVPMCSHAFSCFPSFHAFPGRPRPSSVPARVHSVVMPRRSSTRQPLLLLPFPAPSCPPAAVSGVFSLLKHPPSWASLLLRRRHHTGSLPRSHTTPPRKSRSPRSHPSHCR